MEEKKEFMLTTFDNPFNPFEEFEAWWKQDLLLGHDCCGVLAKEAATSNYWSDEKNEEEIERAANYLVQQNPTLFKKVYRNDFLVSA